jgi:hypothetical protein
MATKKKTNKSVFINYSNLEYFNRRDDFFQVTSFLVQLILLRKWYVLSFTFLKKILLYGMGLLYIMAGVNHFLQPQMYLQIMPTWLPAHSLLVSLSGIAEVILGVS